MPNLRGGKGGKAMTANVQSMSKGRGGGQRRHARWYLMFMIVLCMGLFVQSDIQAFTLDVRDETGAAVNSFYYLVEEDTTHPVTPGVRDPNSLGTSIHRSHAPVITSGRIAAADPTPYTINVPNDKRYVVSVLPDGNTHTLSGTNITVGQVSATVYVHTLPIPTAQISVLIFDDVKPIDNAPNLPFEKGLQNFSILVFDQLGQMSQDAFGNPLGTTYAQNPDGTFQFNPDGSPVVAVMGTGVILSDANGEATVKFLPPGKYGIRAVPPDRQKWSQTATIEGTPGVDSWVKANEPSRLYEFGPGLYHVFLGFVQEKNLLNTIPNPAFVTGTITGKVVTTHTGRPPDMLLYEGYPVPECWIGLNTTAGDGVYVAPCNADSTFTINNVPPGTYQIVLWDTPLDYIFGFHTVIVPTTGGLVNTGNITMNAWFGTYEGSVFYDANENGKKDPGEQGIANQAVNIRFRDGTIYQAQPTDLSGEFSFVEVFPFFKYLIYEVDYLRYKPTGATLVVDEGGPLAPGAKNNPQIQPDGLPYRTELGPVLLEAMTLYADQTNTIDWGKVPYPPDENGGIVGIVYYATTRAENDPRLAVGDAWEPGIARVQVNLYRDANADGVIDDINGTPGIQMSDVDNYPLGWSDGGSKGAEDVVNCGDGVTFCQGDAISVTHTDSWDDNLPTGCVGPPETVYGQPIVDCAETMRTWNQARPAVFDGGYAFGSLVGENLAPGTYIVEAVTPPGYEIVKEEDKNVDFGESYTPSPLVFIPPPCVGNLHPVPQFLSLFPGEPNPSNDPYDNTKMSPLCDRRQVTLTNGKNAVSDFHMFTFVPKAARGVGLINNDVGLAADANSPLFTEKAPASWVPISVQDFSGQELLRTYTDEWGAYNFLAPSSYSVNAPIPTGVSPNMLRLCLNHPGPIPDPANPGQFIPDPNFRPEFSLTCYTLDFWPGKTTYLDTPVIQVAAFATVITASLDCEYPDGTPVLSDVTGPGAVGPYATVGQTITLMSPGTVNVRNPACGDIDPLCSPTIPRDFGFGNTQGAGSVKVNGVNLTNITWSNTLITGVVPAGMTTGQLVVTRSNGISTIDGVTMTIGGPAPTVVTPGNSIQTAIDSANTGDLIIVRPGSYVENPIMWKNVRLQGSSAFSTVISAAAIIPEKVQLWRSKINGLIAGGNVSLIPGENPDLHLETAGITVVANNGVFGNNPKGRIDGFKIVSATEGGGITVNGYAHYLEISNNRILNNAGTYAGGIRVGTPSLLDPSCVDANGNPTYCSSANDHISIRNNQIAQNGSVASVIGGGGIGIYNGSDFYEVKNNFVCGNFTAQKGAGIAHVGLSNNGVISENKFLFNESSFGTITGGEGGGILVSGEPAPLGATGGLTPGAGFTTISSNLVQGNLAGSSFGGGICGSYVNGQDVFRSKNNSSSWYRLDIFNNMIVNNVAGYAGGGIFLEDTVKSRIINNTVTNNASTASGANAFVGLVSTPQGAGIVSNLHSATLTSAIGTGGAAEFNKNFSNPILYNNIVWQNRSFYYDSAQATNVMGGLVANPTTPFWDLQVFGATTFKLNPQYSILTSTSGYATTNRGGTANDPRFVSPYLNQLLATSAPAEGGNFVQVTLTPLTLTGNYHIQSNSPAINRGSNNYLSLVPTDYDRQSRVGTADIGADEYSTAAPVPPPVAPTITVTTPNGGQTWTRNSLRTIQWTYTGNPGTTVRIELLKGGNLNRTISSAASTGFNGNGSYPWFIPSNQTTGNDFTVRITSTSNAAATDTSNANFTIN
jgi:large repetitive protein